MKKMIFLSILSLSFTFSLIAQTRLNENNIRSALTQIFDYSKNQNFKKLAPLLMDDEELRTFDYQNSTDQRAVKRVGKKIKAYLDLSDSYSFESLTFGKFENLSSAEVEVNFKSGEQDLNISFIFVEQENKILLIKFK